MLSTHLGPYSSPLSGRPKAVKTERCALHPRRQRYVLDAALVLDGYPIRPERRSSHLVAWKLSHQPLEP
jgi:hypothetical protein